MTMAEATLPAREEVPLEQTWHLESIFPSLEEWKAAYDEVKARLPELAEYEGELEQGPQSVLACLSTWQEVMRLAEKVFVY
ncbi:MAG: oligoendopeptidase F, partial [Chloroflexota bacterium]